MTKAAAAKMKPITSYFKPIPNSSPTKKMVETQETPLAEQPSDMSAEKRQLSQSREELVPSAKRVKMTQDLETSTVSHPEDGPLFDHDFEPDLSLPRVHDEISLSPRKPARKLPFQVEGISDELSLISSANLDKITAPKPRTPPVVLETDGEDDDDFDLMVDPSFHMSVAPKEAIEVESLKVATRHSTRMRKQTTPFTIAVGGKRGSYAESDESSLVAGLAQKNKILQSLLDDKRKHDKISKSASALSLHLEMESKAEHEETLDSLQSKVEGLIRSAADGEDAETVASLVKEDLSRLTVSVLVLVGEPKPFPPVELTFEASESDLVGRPLVTALKGPDVARSLSSPALLLSVQSGWNMPAEILDWLYKTVCFSADAKIVNAAAKILVSLIESTTVSPMPLELFEEALQTYGVDRQLLQSESAHITDFSHLRDLSSSPTPQGLAAKFPVNNFRAVLRVFVSSLQARKDSYPLTTPARLISLLVKLSLDDQTPYTILHTSLQRLSHLVEPFPHSSSPDGPSPPPAEWISICKSLTAFAGADPRAQDLIVLSPGSPLKRRDPWFFEASRRLAAWWIRRAGPGGGFGTEVSQSPLESGTLSLEQWAEQFSWAKELTHIASIVSQYRTPPATTNHELLACRVRLLAAAVSNIETVRQFPLQSTVLMQELGRLHGSISDARLTNLDRTLAKNDIHHLAMWIELCLPQKRTGKVQALLNFTPATLDAATPPLESAAASPASAAATDGGAETAPTTVATGSTAESGGGVSGEDHRSRDKDEAMVGVPAASDDATIKADELPGLGPSAPAEADSTETNRDASLETVPPPLGEEAQKADEADPVFKTPALSPAKDDAAVTNAAVNAVPSPEGERRQADEGEVDFKTPASSPVHDDSMATKTATEAVMGADPAANTADPISAQEITQLESAAMEIDSAAPS